LSIVGVASGLASKRNHRFLRAEESRLIAEANLEDLPDSIEGSSSWSTALSCVI
jgi:hypothetical protein